MTLGVLVVDDDFRVAGIHASYVEAHRAYRVVASAHTAAAALDAAVEHHPDLVLLDNYLPDRTGLEILGDLHTDVFLVTAERSVTAVRAALRAGALGVIIKPFGKSALTARLDAYVRFRRYLPDGDTELTQEAVDRALAALHSGPRPSAGGDLESITARLVADAVRTSGGEVSAALVSSRLGIARPTAQRYLAGLVEAGRCEVSLRYGSAGRPEHWYSWTAGDDVE